MLEGAVDQQVSQSPSRTPDTEEQAPKAGWYVLPLLLIGYPIWIITYVISLVGLFFIFLIRKIAGYPRKSRIVETLERRVVRPRETIVCRPPLAFQDKAGCPFTIVDFTYVYPEDLDVDVLCESLSRLITDLPVLGGRVSGYMRSLHVRCDAHSGVEVTVAESGFTLNHANHASLALKKRDAMHSHVFAASDPWDPFRTIVASAPVMRVRLTFLAGGGCVLSVAVPHSVADAHMVMKVVELWASEARVLALPRAPISDTIPPPPTASTAEEGKMPVQTSQPSIRTAGDEEERRVTGRSRWRLISPLIYDGLAREAGRFAAPLTFGRFFEDYGNCLKASADFAKLWFVRGVETEHFFFSDHELVSLKSQVMDELRQGDGLGRPHFVSTNDVLSALLWKACVSCPSQRSLMGTHRCLTSLDVRRRLVQPSVLGTAKEGGFPLNNCTLAVVSAHEDVRNASLLTLSCTHRTALDAYDDKAARAKLGEIAKKDGPLGLLMGPECFNWDVRRDVLISSYSPLQGDTDFGSGKAVFGVADLVPSVPFYIQLNHGVDPLNGDRTGMYASICANPQDMAVLRTQLSQFLPTPMPPTIDPLPIPCEPTPEQAKEEPQQRATREAPQGEPDEEKMELESINLNDDEAGPGEAGPAAVPVVVPPVVEEKKPTRQRWVNGPPRNPANEPKGLGNPILDVLGVLVLYVVRLMAMTPRLMPGNRS